MVSPVIAIVSFVIYHFVIQPKVQLPLSNEQDEGEWRIPLPQLGVINEGRVTTARRYVQSLWSQLIDNTEATKRAPLIKKRDTMLKYHLFAQKIGRGKILYLFDENPLDPQFHMREDRPVRFGSDIPIRFVYGIKDCISGGQSDGFEYIAVKLNPEESKITETERECFGIELEAVKALKLAASNQEAIKAVKDENENLQMHLHETQEALASERSEKERARRALGQKSLTVHEPMVQTKPYWRTVSKSFFSWPQVALALIVYLIVPNILSRTEITYPDPGTLYKLP